MMNILIVEDDRTSRTILRRILESMGDVFVSEAEDGQKAWDMLDEGLVPDLCFFDINMPRLSGLDLLKRIRANSRFPGLKVCFCSAVRDRNVIVQAASYKPDFYILKPYSKNAIIAQVQKTRGEVNPNANLDSAEAVCARLGIGMDTYLVMLKSLTDELNSVTARIPNMLLQLNVSGALMALDEIKSAAENMGAHRVYHLADTLTKYFKSDSGLIGRSSESKEEVAANMQQWITRYSDRLMQIIGEMRDELKVIDGLSQKMAQSQEEARGRQNDVEARKKAEMDLMSRALTDSFQRGKLLGSTSNVRAKSLNIPVKASMLGEDSEQTMGMMTRKLSFTYSIFDEQTTEAIDDCRKINDLVKILSFQLEEGARWMPESAVRLLEHEIAARNEQGVMLLRHTVGDNLESFYGRQEAIIRENLKQMCPEGPDTNKFFEKLVKKVIDDVKDRVQPIYEGHLTAEPVFSTLDIGTLNENVEDSKWAAPYAVLQNAALLFRTAATDPAFDRNFKFSTFDRQAYLQAMNVFNDPLGFNANPERATKELEHLNAIATCTMPLREKCRMIWGLLKGEAPAIVNQAEQAAVSQVTISQVSL